MFFSVVWLYYLTLHHQALVEQCEYFANLLVAMFCKDGGSSQFSKSDISRVGAWFNKTLPH